MDMRYFDAHTHVNFAAFSEDADAVIARARGCGTGMNIVGTQLETSRAALALAERHDGVYATVGLHPIHTSRSYHDEQELGVGGAKAFTSRGEEFDPLAYEELARSAKVIAIGECGLDYYRLDEHSRARQEAAFIEQIELANRLDKPLMLHIRSTQTAGEAHAYADALALVKAHASVKGNVHFFAGTWDDAKQFLELGFTLSFTGVITFARDYDDVVRNAPLDMLLSETDAPYVSPAPYRGKRNEPAYVVEVVRAIARIRGEEEQKVAAQLMENARRMFSLRQ
ncbi:hydrolase TatD [Candidatus Kaiserbacteria bacterium CG10_big_fil_rev_8_21_14_0_10_59_10]|uniref:Hydrolase TatD n=1 Tax=Candidatus Kaiserbacteria bacterium CG10_big_fil_rev_8_21_14_0_10_59_10 TaxID=1974612 RepID=A0A2H0U8L1_9BACT|nr:MAG: hydrolase TatD [Candidatus Kaiserbacteria bacterium CG10_big_fil_rev_8_21_14_0_10_59_10]